MKKKKSYILNSINGFFTPDSWQKLGPCDVLLIRHDHDCGYNFNGKPYAQFIDSLGELISKQNLTLKTIATPFSKLTGEKAFNSPVSYNRAALFHTLIGKTTGLLLGRSKGEKIAGKLRTNLWLKMLDKAKPRVVIGIQPDNYACRASKKMGIPVYDLQHGVIEGEIIYYGEKFRKNSPPEDLPTGILCWDNPSTSEIKKWSDKKGVEVLIIGNPWFMRFIDQRDDDVLVKEFKDIKPIFKESKPVILVSLQWGLDVYYKNPGFNMVMIDELEKVILETANSYNWMLRLHPVQLRGKEGGKALEYLDRTFGKLDSVEWKKSSSLPLPLVLKQTDLHITDMSTTVIEAAWLGIKSALLNICICPGGIFEDLYIFERTNGLADVLKHDEKLIRKWIENNIITGKKTLTIENTKNNLNSFINKI